MKKTPLKKKAPLKNRGSKLKKSNLAKKKSVQKRKRNIAKKEKRKKNPSSTLWNEIKKCDTAFSQYVRLKDADKNGEVKCYTCEAKAFWKQDQIECGHYKGRGSMNTRWNGKNAKPQCIRCNRFLQGNIEVFAENLVKEYGEGILEYLDKESKTKVQLTIVKVRNLRTYYESQVVKLKEKCTT